MTFFDNDLLNTKYLRRLKKVQNPHRNQQVFIESLDCIHNYNPNHANSFVRKIKNEYRNNQPDIKNCEAVFTETIVYVYYLRLLHEGIVKSLDIEERDYDLRIELADGSFHYLEIFSIVPDNRISISNGINPIKPILNTVRAHLKDDPSSAYQKILRKINKQRQLTKARKNFVVIEINDLLDMVISVLSPIFDEPDSKYIKGIILFNRGNYNKRDCIINPNFMEADSTTVA